MFQCKTNGCITERVGVTTPSVYYPRPEGYCDCNERCKRCGRKKRPYPEITFGTPMQRFHEGQIDVQLCCRN